MDKSIPAVVDMIEISGPQAAASAAPDLLIEIPHGATRTTDFTSLESRLTSPLPEGLSDFFHVNTDAGAPEMGEALARELVKRKPAFKALILRCLIPRTFIDCNRRIDASREEFKAGKVTPGLMPWIVTDADRGLLLQRYRQYTAVVRACAAQVMPKGAMVLMHTYAPRTVGVEVDLNIVKSLRAAYVKGVEETWPLRPEIDVISRDDTGKSWTNRAVFDALKTQMHQIGISVADSATYPMHQSTLAYNHVTTWPERVMCVEVRRDLLADPFVPFAEQKISEVKAAKLAGPMANAFEQWWA